MNRSAVVQTPSRRSDEIPGRLCYPVPEVAVLMGGVSERFVWKLLASGELLGFPLGRRTVVYHDDLDEFLLKLREDEKKARAMAAKDAA